MWHNYTLYSATTLNILGYLLWKYHCEILFIRKLPCITVYSVKWLLYIMPTFLITDFSLMPTSLLSLHAVVSTYCIHPILLHWKLRVFINFVITGTTGGRQPPMSQWRQSWHHGNSGLSLYGCTLYPYTFLQNVHFVISFLYSSILKAKINCF